MKHLLAIVHLLFLFTLSLAQTQYGYVRSAGRNSAPGKPLPGVRVLVKGPYNAVMSLDDGTFSIVMDGIRNGDKYVLASVQKDGYELIDPGVIGRPLGFSSNVTLELVMLNSAQIRKEQREMAERFREKMTVEFDARVSELKAKKDANEITLAKYQEEITRMYDYLDNQEVMIESLTERYVRQDYDRLDSLDRIINHHIEMGEFEQAQGLINSKGDINSRMESILVAEEHERTEETAIEQMKETIDEKSRTIVEIKNKLKGKKRRR